MKKYFIMATYRVELRGIVLASTEDDARRTMKDNWHVYDDRKNTVRAGSFEPGLAAVPILGAMDDYLRVTHIEDVTLEEGAISVPCRACGVRSGEPCESINRHEPIDSYHGYRQQDYNKMMFAFSRYARIEGSHI